MGKPSRRRARHAALLVANRPDTERTLPDGQRMARVNIAPDLWAEFRGASTASGRSVADYLGHLVQKELRRVRRREWRAARLAQSPGVVTGGADTRAEVM
jgi:hypothetical protein